MTRQQRTGRKDIPMSEDVKELLARYCFENSLHFLFISVQSTHSVNYDNHQVGFKNE